MAITLAQARELSDSKLTTSVIDEFRKSALLDRIPFDNCVKRCDTNCWSIWASSVNRPRRTTLSAWVSGVRSGQDAIAAAVQTLVGSALSAAHSIGSTYSPSSLPKYRTGLEYVPADDYPALLHKGEAVLTAAEAALWRSAVFGNNASSPGLNISQQVSSGNGQLGELHVHVILGEEEVAEYIEPIVSERQAKRTTAMRG